MIDDGELLRHYVEDGSQAAFTQLVERYAGLVYSCALRRTGGHAAQASDIVQSVFVTLAAKARYLGGHPSLAGWLHTTAYYCAAKLLRSDRRRRQREFEAHAMSAVDARTGSSADWEAIKPLLDEALLKLGTVDREVVLLRFMEGLSFAEIGSRLGMTEAAAQKRAGRALERVRGRLAGTKGAMTSVGGLAVLLSSHAGSAAPAGLAHSVSSAALASSLPSGAVAIHLFRIMSTTKMSAGVVTFVGLATLVGVVSTAAGLYELRQERRDQTLFTAASQRLAADDKALQAFEQGETRRAARAKGESDAGFPGGNAGRKGQTASASRSWAAIDASDPEAHRQMTSFIKSEFNEGYRLFLAQAGLSPEQRQALEERIVGAWMSNLQIRPNGGLNFGAGPGPEEIRAIIGDKAAQEFADYNRRAYANNLAVRLSTSTGYTDSPLSAGQQIQVAQIVAQNSPEYLSGSVVNLDTVDWAAAYTQIQGALSPDQWKIAQGTLMTIRVNATVARVLAADAAAQKK